MKLSRSSRRRRRGFLQFDLVIGLAILTIAILPIGYAFSSERQALRTEYRRCVINELVDGEMEILVAGAARNLPDGSQTLPVQSRAMNLLPAGHFQLIKAGNHLQLSWMPDEKCGFSAVVRETTLK
ncbi:MAG: hypothetical protein P4N60_14780 [Verrucomicrobiae bacterium]|nr:hypothetical protein [Verrucomicrobiae bacterium]